MRQSNLKLMSIIIVMHVSHWRRIACMTMEKFKVVCKVKLSEEGGDKMAQALGILQKSETSEEYAP
ncbi:TPA: hypothetical protein ACGW44_002635 [Bacillus toyonensis]